MDSFKIFIAAVVIIAISSLLIGCSGKDDSASEENVPSVSIEALKSAARLKRDVALELSAEREGKEVHVTVALANPSHHPLTSVQSWLTYDPETLKGVKIDVGESLFALTAPYESAFDENRGLVRIGRGTEKPITDLKVTVAKVTFQVLHPGVTMLNVYDYKSNLRGHASANMMNQSKPANVLLKPKNPALIIQ